MNSTMIGHIVAFWDRGNIAFSTTKHYKGTITTGRPDQYYMEYWLKRSRTFSQAVRKALANIGRPVFVDWVKVYHEGGISLKGEEVEC